MIKDMFVLGQLLPGEEYIKGYPDNCFPHWLRMIDQAKRKYRLGFAVPRGESVGDS